MNRQHQILISSNHAEKGTALILFCIYLSVIVAIFLGMASGFYLIKTELTTTNICRKENIRTMELLRIPFENLLRLNPKALSLRINLSRAQVTLAAAIASGNAPLAAIIKAEIKVIKSQQKILDKLQKKKFSRCKLPPKKSG